jgi:hypothetical protein
VIAPDTQRQDDVGDDRVDGGHLACSPRDPLWCLEREVRHLEQLEKLGSRGGCLAYGSHAFDVSLDRVIRQYDRDVEFPARHVFTIRRFANGRRPNCS